MLIYLSQGVFSLYYADITGPDCLTTVQFAGQRSNNSCLLKLQQISPGPTAHDSGVNSGDIVEHLNSFLTYIYFCPLLNSNTHNQVSLSSLHLKHLQR